MQLSETLGRLRRMRATPLAQGDLVDRLSNLEGFTANPGKLTARCYVPDGAAGPMPLVVVLHGCTQTAGAYDHGSGWSQLADRHGFALLFPEQQRVNNANLCFNWFQPEDTRRGAGEAASIAAMVARMQALHAIDPARIFVTGLSAGGAMTSAMLAAYPDLFAGGAIIAGLAHGLASDVGGAFSGMSTGSQLGGKPLGDLVRKASPHCGPWPRVSIWHGGADQTVAVGNADAIARQWADVHGLGPTPTLTDTLDGQPRLVWLDRDGRHLIEQVTVAGMGHGTPLDPGSELGQSGRAGPHMLDVGISSTDRIAAFFGLSETSDIKATPVREPVVRLERIPLDPPPRAAPPPPAAAASGVQKVIEDALRSAGLMR